MGKKAGIGIGAIAVAIIGIFATGEGTNWTFDFSTTTIGQIGDNIINNYLADQGIDLDEFRAMCDAGTVHEEIKQYCRLV